MGTLLLLIMCLDAVATVARSAPTTSQGSHHHLSPHHASQGPQSSTSINTQGQASKEIEPVKGGTRKKRIDKAARRRYSATYRAKQKALGVSSKQKIPAITKFVKLPVIEKGLLSDEVFVSALEQAKKAALVGIQKVDPMQQADQEEDSIKAKTKHQYISRRDEKADLCGFARGAPLPDEVKGVRLEELKEQIKAAGGPRAFFGEDKYGLYVHRSREYLRERSHPHNEKMRLLRQRYGPHFPKELVKKSLQEVEILTGTQSYPFQPAPFNSSLRSPTTRKIRQPRLAGRAAAAVTVAVQKGVSPGRQKSKLLGFPLNAKLPRFVAEMSLGEFVDQMNQAGSARAFLGQDYDALLEKARLELKEKNQRKISLQQKTPQGMASSIDSVQLSGTSKRKRTQLLGETLSGVREEGSTERRINRESHRRSLMTGQGTASKEASHEVGVDRVT